MQSVSQSDVNQICYAVITRISVLKHQFLTEREKEDSRQAIDDLINRMDRMGISWKLQNQMFYVAEKYDVRSHYLSDLLNMAVKRANEKHNQ